MGRGAPDDDIPAGIEDESRRYELLNDIGSETEAAGIHHFSTPFITHDYGYGRTQLSRPVRESSRLQPRWLPSRRPPG